MKLFFDENLSPRLVTALSDTYPGSSHVDAAGLGNALDRDVWQYAKQHGLILVTKDSDFHELSLLHGAPPKVVWIRRGNCSTSDIERILRTHVDDIESMVSNPDVTYLILL